MTRILFVCMGNICRSPMAEGICRHLAQESGLGIEADSAGTGGWHVGAPPDPRAVRAARAHGIDISDLRARQFSAEDCQDFDHIVAMDRDNLAHVERLHVATGGRARLSLLLDHAAIPIDEVPDPYSGDEAGFQRCFDLIWRGVEGLMAAIADGQLASQGSGS
ncbi:MAG: low molecular weight protein-tyrosine-phosphatase [Rhodothalassiaceae bacterium]